MAILNVDGLDQQLSDECMGQLYAALRAPAEEIADRIATAPSITLRVTSEPAA